MYHTTAQAALTLAAALAAALALPWTLRALRRSIRPQRASSPDVRYCSNL